jgi:hypothetical protein
VNIRTSPGNYQFVGWTNFTQAALQELMKNDKLARSRAVHRDHRGATTQENRGRNQTLPRLNRPPNGSLLGALFSSSVGIFSLLLIYAANLYAGYEIAVVRAYPPVMVCGISAVAPFVGPAIFLSCHQDG